MNIIKQLFDIGIGTIISIIISAVSTPIVTRIVSPGEYGFYNIFLSISSICMSFLTLGLDQSLLRFYYVCDEKKYKTLLFKKCIKIPIFFSFVFLFFIVFLYKKIPWLIEFDLLDILILSTYIILLVLTRFFQLVMRLEFDSKNYSISVIIQKISYVVILLILIYLTKNSKSIVLCISITISYAITTAFLFISNKNLIEYSKNKLSYNITYKELLEYALPFMLSMFIFSIFQSIDKLIIKEKLGLYEVGIYSSAVNLMNLIAIIQTTFSTVWSPISMKKIEEDPEDIEFHKIANKAVTVIMFFISFSIILVKDIFVLFLGEEYRAASMILPLLLFYPIMYTISETTIAPLLYYKKVKIQIVISVLVCLISILLNIVFIPIFGLKGSALSMGLSYIFFYFIRVYFSNKVYYVDYDNKKMLLILFIAIIYALYNCYIEFNIFSIVIYFIVLIILYVLYKSEIKTIIIYIKENIRLLLFSKHKHK